MKNTIQLKKKTFELRKFIKTREMATDHEITTLNLMSDVGILGIDTRNSFPNCYYSHHSEWRSECPWFSFALLWTIPGPDSTFIPLSFLFVLRHLLFSIKFLYFYIYIPKKNCFLKVEQIFSVSIQTNHCERENLEITPKIIVLLKIQCSKNFLGLTGPSIAFEIISKCSLFTIFLKFMQNNGECPTHICFCLVLVWFCFLNEENCLYL